MTHVNCACVVYVNCYNYIQTHEPKNSRISGQDSVNKLFVQRFDYSVIQGEVL